MAMSVRNIKIITGHVQCMMWVYNKVYVMRKKRVGICTCVVYRSRLNVQKIEIKALNLLLAIIKNMITYEAPCTRENQA